MATYYVDGVNGLDTNNGTSPETAWKTINKATQTMQAGDTTYVKPCIYRESATFANSGADGSPIQLIGDINGEYWGIKGKVRITNIDNDSDISGTRDSVINALEAKHYITIKNIHIDTISRSNGDINIVATKGNNFTMENCVIQGLFTNVNYSIAFVVASWNNSAKNYMFKNCIFIGSEKYQKSSGYSNCGFSYVNSSAVSDTNINFENCIFMNLENAIKTDFKNSINVKNCLFINCNKAFYCVSNDWGGDYSLKIYNSFFMNISTLLTSSGTSTITESNNYYIAVYSFGNVGKFGTKRNVLLDYSKIYFDDLKMNLLIDLGCSSGTNYDFNNNPRPLKSGYDVGPWELSDEPIQESTIKESGSYSAKLVKAEFKDFTTFLSSGSHTISVKVKWSGYTGENKPQLIIKQDKYCGINSDQVATATGDGTNWETLSKDITLSKSAEITIRIYSRDIGTDALTYFDSLDIT